MWSISIIVFVGVACLVGGIMLSIASSKSTLAEERLGTLQLPGPVAPGGQQGAYVRELVQSLRNEKVQFQSLEQFAMRWINLRPFVEQSGVQLTPGMVVFLSVVIALAGGLLGLLTPFRLLLAPILAVLGGVAPLAWVFYKRWKRLTTFEHQMPEVLELLARSLRAGRSLADGVGLVAEEMRDPVAGEFARCHEQQHLGMAIEDSLREMALRVPILDLHFFVTAVVLQRQTGGDMAEILDKIGRLVRERFQIRGQIKALTGEGRLSGVVLLALPVALGMYMYFRNPEYLMVLFQDPLGQKMVIGAAISQLVGMLVIKKIVDIRV